MNFSHQRTPRQSAQEYGRGIAGGLIFSIPILYTMEVWWAGFLLHPLRILFYMAATFVLLMLYNRFAGLRQDASLAEVAIDSVEELGIGLLLSAAILWFTDRIKADMGVGEVIGKIAMESMTVAIGVSVGTAQLGAKGEDTEGLATAGRDASSLLPQMSLALCGAILFAANVAPTEEIRVIAAGAPAAKLMLLVVFSLLLAWLVLHVSDFRGAATHVAPGSSARTVRSVAITCAVAWIASGLSLWFFGQLDRLNGAEVVAEIVVLGLPATLGASAGRLLVQSSPDSSES